MTEGPRKRRVEFSLERSLCAIALAALAIIAIAWLYGTPVNMWLASSVFLIAPTCALGAIGIFFGYGRVGAAIGLLLGAAYLAHLFWTLPNGGYLPDLQGWPIDIPIVE